MADPVRAFLESVRRKPRRPRDPEEYAEHLAELRALSAEAPEDLTPAEWEALYASPRAPEPPEAVEPPLRPRGGGVAN